MKATPNYSVIYSDQDIIVLNKKSGLCVAADRYDEEAPRLDLLAQKEFGELFAVHRIDKDTSGIVVYARNAQAHKDLCGQFAGRSVHKIYHCLVRGRPLWQDLNVSLALMPDGDARHRTVVSKSHGKPSITDFHFIGSCGPFSWIEASPKTGRTHQIRAHLQANNLSIVADPLYSGNQRGVYLSEIKKRWNGDAENERPLIDRLALHAWKIQFEHPTTRQTVEFTAPYPRDLEAARKQLAKIFGVDPLAQEESQ